MTEDFKKKILNWLSGNYAVGSGNNVPQFSETDAVSNNLESSLNSLFPNGYWFKKDDILQTYDINGDELKYTIVWGIYYTNQAQTQQKNVILILDEDFDLLQAITHYSSGTEFGKFEKIGVGEDGNFFAIENTGSSKRFVMMNNIIAKLPTEDNYKVVLKKSYTLQGNSTNIYTFEFLKKIPNQSIYLIGGYTFLQDIIITEFIINVGTSNEWNDFSYTNEQNKQYWLGDVYLTINSSNELSFKIAGALQDYGGSSGQSSTYATLSGTSTNVGTLTLNTFGYLVDDIGVESDFKIISENECYVMARTTDLGDQKQYMEIYRVVNGNVSLLYKKRAVEVGGIYVNVYSNARLEKINNEMFFFTQFVSGTEANPIYNLEIGRIIGNDIYSKVVMTDEVPIEYMFFIVQKQFNLYNFYIQLSTSVLKTFQIYNSFNYNGIEYQDYDSMIPTSAVLLSYQVPVFARNLYNRVINSNTTISIINVPNSYINDINITEENLYGKTKSLLINQYDIFNTNIYEELMINFVNTLLMRNENDINNKIDNLAGAIRLNKSISSLLDYDNCKITKYKINYNDNTSTIFNFPISNINYLANKTTYTISFYNENVKNIQIISNDENTIYQTIDISKLETGKYYLINQDLHIV